MANSPCSGRYFKRSLGFKAKVIHEEYIFSDDQVDILSFDKNFREIDIAQGFNFKSRRSWKFHNYTNHVHPGYKDTEKFRGGVQW